MKTLLLMLLIGGAMPALLSAQVTPLPSTDDLIISSAQVRYLPDLETLVFEQAVKGQAGRTLPQAAGQMHGAPVLGYVFPTTLEATDVGFSDIDGIVALAVTSHPDFDDTPLWDENGNSNFDDDGIVYHTHWVVLGPDERVPGGLAVIETKKEEAARVLPPTAPGMPMYLDSPGFPVLTRRHTLRVMVPASRINGKYQFNFDAVSVYMEVNTEDADRPLLGVYAVYSVLSGDLSLPYTVSK